MKNIFRILVICLVLCSCESIDEPNYKKVSFEKFNLQIDSASLANEVWVNDPILVVLKFMEDISFSKDRNIELKVLSIGEVANDVSIKLSDNGLMDDSVESEQRLFRLKKTKNVWHIISFGKCWKCQSGRGSSTYDTILCN